MKDWNDPYAEGDHEYDHSAGTVFVGLIQGLKYIGALILIGGASLIVAFT